MNHKNTIKGSILCKKGVVRMAANNDIHGDVYAMALKQGAKNNINGKFVKSSK